MDSFQIESRRIDTGERMVTVLGEIDLATAPDVAEAIKRCHGRVVVDLRKVPFMDSTGLRVLLTEQNRLVDEGGSLRLLIAGEQLKRLFAITGLEETFRIDRSIHPSTNTPLTALGNASLGVPQET